MMLRGLVLFVIFAFTNNSLAQVKLADPDYLKIIGSNQSDFIEWAKSIDKWNSYNLIIFKRGTATNYFGDTIPRKNPWDATYEIACRKMIKNIPFVVEYRYFFQSNRCIQIDITPYQNPTWKNWNDELKKDFELISRIDSANTHRTIYRNQNDAFRISLYEFPARSGSSGINQKLRAFLTD